MTDTTSAPLNGFSLLEGHPTSGTFASADFADAEDTRPAAAYNEALGGHDAINGIVTQTITRHLSEALPASASPQLTSYTTQLNNWRKRLREMMIHQNEHILGFLMKPVEDHPIIGPVEQALRRYAVRQDIDYTSIKTMKQVCSDVSGAETIQKEIADCISKKGKSSLLELSTQVTALIDLYKETGERLLECENQLKMRLEKIDKIQKRVSVVIELQKNDGTLELVNAMENYLKVSFRDLGIESHYKTLIHLYQKHIALREAIQVFKTGSQLPSEPTCPICLGEAVGTAIVPCGHTFCTNCARRMSLECGVCRGKIRERLKLYFS
jgi:hypothetical protein